MLAAVCLSRGRKTPSEAKQAAEAKQARAGQLRQALAEERAARLARAKECWEQKQVAAKGKVRPWGRSWVLSVGGVHVGTTR